MWITKAPSMLVDTATETPASSAIKALVKPWLRDTSKLEAWVLQSAPSLL